MSELKNNITNKNNTTEFVNKRIDLTKKSLKQIKIIASILDDNVDNKFDKNTISYIINKAVNHYFNSEEIQNQLKEL
ncbi:hypothetical protein DEFDS_P065 (plasmid) [Deferribacter desulfuricans SSM1]|uniref:Uncharacterized protein n=1 Tax=Deferribacter desulfuricans (strain DSM 14783 / JCM 11476 / NBRC 101012 / SSM1) TaxID=639282 RepID=D3PEP7_DEFDS|nr:hypothetical protein [Deferribacter desulfuricans]BAI81689.1 hypothetical protein DEFDS_P065 [Deferribacter desulfuricans SSM1]